MKGDFTAKQRPPEGKERAQYSGRIDDHLFYSPTIYQPSFLSTALPLNTHLATYHNARTKEKDRWSSIRIGRLDLLVEALGEGGDNVLQSRLEVLAQRSLLVNCSQKIRLVGLQV
jgi:hypothetical protein